MFRQNGGDGFQKLDAVRAEIADVVVGKALPNVAEGRRAEQRIHDCVGQDVGVGVAVQSLFKRNFNAAEDELSPGCKAVGVFADAYSEHITYLRC